MRFIFLTKTEWQEAPRLRHQLAYLLADAGHDVEFFEKPLFPWQHSQKNDSGHPRIHLHRYRQLIHHKLRVARVLHHLNAACEKRQIRVGAERLSSVRSDVVVVFNYDYFFIRDVFPEHKIILIINDDFWSRAIAGHSKPLKWALTQTCRTSDKVLAVSSALVEQLRSYCKPELFLPWADVPYRPPQAGAMRHKLLYWGYIGSRIDYSYVIKLAKGIHLRGLDYEIILVGPIQSRCKKVKDLACQPGIKLHESSSLDDLHLDTVLCGFIPYRANVPDIDAITMPNKTLQQLARGLPQVIMGMPSFVDQPFVFRMTGDIDNDIKILGHVKSLFDDLQPAISVFVESNTGEERLRTFLNYTS